MPESPVLSPELTRLSVALARALSAAVRNWTLYPPEHPAVGSSLARLGEAVQQSAQGAVFSFGVTPDTLLVAGVPLGDDQPVLDAARLLHDRDILHLTFAGEVPAPALATLLRLLTSDPAALRAQGGPAAVWEASGHAAVAIEQIDYRKVLEDHDVAVPLDHRDDVWRSIVASVLDPRAILDERQQQRLLRIAGSPAEIGDLARDVMAPRCNVDGSPMITTQAATVLAAFRHLAGIVSVLQPGRVPELMRNVAAAASTLDPYVIMQVVRSEDAPDERVPVVRGLTDAFDDDMVAGMLATVLSRDGKASARLAAVFDTIAPDEERKRRVLRLTRSMLTEQDFGRAGQFKAIWASMEELLLTYDETPYMSAGYQSALDGAGARAEMTAARGLPPEIGEWLLTLGQDNVRALSVTLVCDLLRIETRPDRAAKIARDMAALAEDLLLSGDFAGAALVARELQQAGASRPFIAPAAARAALHDLGQSVALVEAAGLIDDLEPATYDHFVAVCTAIGPGCLAALRRPLEAETATTGSTRARALAVSFGAAAVPVLATLAEDPRWVVRRNLAEILAGIGTSEAVPTLQVLLRQGDSRVLVPAVSALAGIDDPSAARAIQTVLRATTGDARAAVVQALVGQSNPRIAPMLVRVLDESDPLGADHPIVVDTLAALGTLADDGAIASIARLVRVKKLFRRQRVLAIKQAGVQALARIGTERARQALDEAGRHGDRLLRRVVREAGGRSPAGARTA